MSNLEAVIAGVPYHLPTPNEPPIESFLTDGSLAHLFSDRVVIGGETVVIPAGLSMAQQLSAGGQTITARPGPSTPPSDGDDEDGGRGGGGGGFFGAIGGIVKSAGSAAGSMGNVGSKALDFASGVGGATAAGLAPIIGTAAKDVGNVVSSLNGAQGAFPANQISQAGLDVFNNAQNLGRRSLDTMLSFNGALHGFESMPVDKQNALKSKVKDFAQPGGVLDKVSLLKSPG
jgi:hypothetical protein